MSAITIGLVLKPADWRRAILAGLLPALVIATASLLPLGPASIDASCRAHLGEYGSDFTDDFDISKLTCDSGKLEIEIQP